MNEFNLIKKYFTHTYLRDDLILGVGDDAAIVAPPPNHDLVFTMDTLVAGVHFPVQTSPFDIGYKTAAVNLSDLAAMGAKPLWATLALTLPEVSEEWLSEFSRGLFNLLDQYEVALIGGDTTRGPLTITLQAHGCVPRGKALRRDGAKIGDLIYVSGTLGDAGFGLQLLQGPHPNPLPQAGEGAGKNPPFEKGGQSLPPRKRGGGFSSSGHEFFLQRLNRPTPRIELGLLARDYANAAIDISDGFAQDLSHILERSKVGAEVAINKLPVSSGSEMTDPTSVLQLALTAGDDYELCLTIPPENSAAFEGAAKNIKCQITCVGKIIAGQELILLDKNKARVNLNLTGYQHYF